MFQELMPLLEQRTLLLMVSRVGADQMRINVIPQRVKSTDTDQIDALFTPLSISGTPKELDQALPAQLVEFVGVHLGLSSTLKSAKEQMDAAAKAAREAARKSTAGKTVTSPVKPAASGEPVEPPASGEAIAHGTARKALQEDQQYVESLIASSEMRKRSSVDLSQEQKEQLDLLFMGWGS